MSNSFFPRTDAQMVIWATNYKSKIASNANALGLSPAQIALEMSYCDDLIVAINNLNAQKSVVKSLVKTKKQIFNSKGAALRAAISRHKTAVGYTDGIGQGLGIKRNASSFNANTFKPQITVSIFAGSVQIKFKKFDTHGINLYHRKKGTMDWSFLARLSKSPFNQHLVLASPGQPEHWEYRAFGVVNDNEIGLVSDIAEIVFGD
jgi:hypothetical protein